MHATYHNVCFIAELPFSVINRIKSGFNNTKQQISILSAKPELLEQSQFISQNYHVDINTLNKSETRDYSNSEESDTITEVFSHLFNLSHICIRSDYAIMRYWLVEKKNLVSVFRSQLKNDKHFIFYYGKS